MAEGEYPELLLDAVAFVRAHLARDQVAMKAIVDAVEPGRLLMGVSALTLHLGARLLGSPERLDRTLVEVLTVASERRASRDDGT